LLQAAICGGYDRPYIARHIPSPQSLETDRRNFANTNSLEVASAVGWIRSTTWKLYVSRPPRWLSQHSDVEILIFHIFSFMVGRRGKVIFLYMYNLVKPMRTNAELHCSVYKIHVTI
jgi:hypothetical protein